MSDEQQVDDEGLTTMRLGEDGFDELKGWFTAEAMAAAAAAD